jgi:hypothetical protein
LTAKAQGFDNMEDKLIVKTQGLGISMLSRPYFLQCFHFSKLNTAWLGWILYLDHTKTLVFNAQTTNQPKTSAKVTVKTQGSAKKGKNEIRKHHILRGSLHPHA